MTAASKDAAKGGAEVVKAQGEGDGGRTDGAGAAGANDKKRDGEKNGDGVNADAIRELGRPPHRSDQTMKCPRCGHFEVPATNGSRLKTDGRYLYRKCARCRVTFLTRRRHGSDHEEVIAG